MPQLKCAIANQIKRLSGQDEASSSREHMRAWLEILIYQGMYSVGRVAVAAHPCPCCRHHATANGNLFHVEIVSARDFQRIKDGRYLPSEIAATVQEKLAGTSHMAADVMVVCFEAGEWPFHIQVDRNGYTIRQTNHTVRENT